MSFLRFVSVAAAAIACGAIGISACARSEEKESAPPATTLRTDVSLSATSPFRSMRAGFESVNRQLLARVESSGEIAVTKKGASSTLSLKTAFAGGETHREAPTLNPSGALERSLGNIVEHVESRADEIEVSWTLKNAPEGGDDFVVRQQFARADQPVRTTHGVRFPSAHLHVSDGTFIDARGKETHIPALLRDGFIEYRVAASTLRESAFPAVLDPTISPESILDPTVVSGYATQRGQVFHDSVFSSTGIAFDGTNYLVTWFDSRGVAPVFQGALVSPSGTIVSPNEIVFGGTIDSKSRYFNLYSTRMTETVAGAGGFLVVWTQEPIAGYDAQMFGQRVTSAGVLVDREPFSLGVLPIYHLVDYTSFGDSFAIPFVTFTSATEQTLKVAVINGVNQADPGVRFLESTAKVDFGKGDFEFDRVRAAGDLVVYGQWKNNTMGGFTHYETHSLRIGNSLSTPQEIDLGGGAFLDVARDSNGFYLLSEVLGGVNGEKLLRTLANDGVTLGEPTSFLHSDFSILHADDAGLLLRETYGPNYRVCPYTKSFDPSAPCFNGLVDRFAASPTKVAFSSTTDAFPARRSITTIEFWDRATGTRSTPERTVLPRSSNSQTVPVAAFDPTNAAYLAVWLDDAEGNDAIVPGTTDGGATSDASGGLRVMGARVRTVGGATQVDPAFPISAAGANAIVQPKVIWDGDRFRVAWQEQRIVDGDLQNRVMVTTVDASSSNAIDPIVVTSSSSAQLSIALSADTTTLTVAWVEGSEVSRVLAKRWPLSAAGINAEALVLSSSGPFTRASLAATFDGKQTILTWLEGPSFGGASFVSAQVEAIAFLDGSSTPSSTSFTLDSSFSAKENLHLASDGKRASVATWASYTGSGRREVRAKLIPRDAIVPTEDAAAVSLSVGPPSDDDNAYPSVAYSNDKESFFIAWSRRRANDWDILGNWVSFDGRVLDPAPGRLISATTAAAVADGGANAPGEDEAFPELCAGPTATAGLAYVRFDSRSNVRSLRARFRTVVSGRLSGETCGANDDCASRYCVDGICCHTACNDGCGQCGGEEGGEKGQCAPKKAGATCGVASRYACSGASTTCPSECTASDASVCAPGLVCRDSQCTPFAAQCFDDFSAITETGPVSCGGYRCTGGACKGTCESVDDCSPGNVCDFQGRCVAPPQVEDAPSCALSSSSSRKYVGGISVSMLIGAVVFGRRRRRCPRTPKNCP